MLNFTIVLRNKDPNTILALLNSHFESHLNTSADEVHRLIVNQYKLIADLKLESESVHYLAHIETKDKTSYIVEELALKEDIGDSVILSIAMTNGLSEQSKHWGDVDKSVYHDANSTVVALMKTFMGDEDFNVCSLHQSKNICVWLLACTNILSKTHLFSVEVTKDDFFHYKAMSRDFTTFISVKTRSWTEVTMHQFMLQNTRAVECYHHSIH